ncbi:DUF2690 domain-containing protein [Streptomyces sp. NPDC018693]|uniref:helix-turn-helix domain-containing protein n=1 Tax=unclassified Streptomyces TaxID=2593676 RepID=UPI0037B3C607
MTRERTRLVAALRELRARTGLSLAALAERTSYSKSSWERYLNGRSLPPRQAVQELCRVADEPDGRLLALWEIAESDWRGRAAAPDPAPAPAPTADAPRPDPQESPPSSGTGRRHGGRGRLLVMLASAYTVIVGGGALVLVLPPDRKVAEGEPLSASAPYSFVPPCHEAACDGRDPMSLVCGISPDSLATYRTATGAHVELRYSEKCGAGWARMWGTRIGDRLDVTADGAAQYVRVEDQDDAETYTYTAMTAVRPSGTIRACFRSAAADGQQECFEARVGRNATPSETVSSR